MIKHRTPEDSDLFDPRHYAAVRQPLLEAQTPPAWCYTSPAFYRREVERIFRREWQFLGRTEQVPAPGDYFALAFAGVPIVVVRGSDGALRAFANSCRHRGSMLLDEGNGNCKAIVCPYHSWVYALDGKLSGTPDMDRTEGFGAGDYPLHRVRLETWAGFMFINFDPAAAPLSVFLGDIDDKVGIYGLGDMVLARRREYPIACNWKLWVENAKESYHIATVHKRTIQRYASAKSAGYAVEPTIGEYCVTFARHDASMALLQGDSGFPVHEPLLGRREAAGTCAPLIYPSTYLACTIDCAWYLEVHPLGPSSMMLVHGALFPRERLGRPDFETLAANYYRRWDITTEEDIVASERQQKGLDSPYATPGRFSHREPLVHAIDNWILDRVLD
ncbi:MAG: aromatic ring-hydroxylating dioxygenase subunit alpha [Proteobacteria bacterium]|nr:aromatic ring-hydroxylating dioxygenase subunit alpha [Burkholderiales bacterium]